MMEKINAYGIWFKYLLMHEEYVKEFRTKEFHEYVDTFNRRFVVKNDDHEQTIRDLNLFDKHLLCTSVLYYTKKIYNELYNLPVENPDDEYIYTSEPCPEISECIKDVVCNNPLLPQVMMMQFFLGRLNKKRINSKTFWYWLTLFLDISIIYRKMTVSLDVNVDKEYVINNTRITQLFIVCLFKAFDFAGKKPPSSLKERIENFEEEFLKEDKRFKTTLQIQDLALFLGKTFKDVDLIGIENDLYDIINLDLEEDNKLKDDDEEKFDKKSLFFYDFFSKMLFTS